MANWFSQFLNLFASGAFKEQRRMPSLAPFLRRRWGYIAIADLERRAWYLKCMPHFHEAVTLYARAGYSQYGLYCITEEESPTLSYAIYFPEIGYLCIDSCCYYYWSQEIWDLKEALDAWVQSPMTWANLACFSQEPE